jgi:DNA replication and repair protein RecF
MFLSTMELQHFRNYNQLSIKFSPRVNIFIGKNAQGKTNLLEAVFLSCLGKSFRTKKDLELIQWGYDSFYLKSCFEANDLTRQIEFGLGKEQKKIKLDGQVVKNAVLFGITPVVVFSPEDLQLVKGGPQIRRDFIDLYLAQIAPQYRNIYLNYYKVLSHRNYFLKGSFPDPTEWEVWDEQLVECGIKVIKYRAALVERIKPYIIAAHRQISVATEQIDLNYLCLNKYLNPKAEQNLLRQMFRDELKNFHQMELERRVSLVGPQRDDLLLSLGNGVDLRSFGSQGQQRTAALALKLGLLAIMQEARETAPLLLLDDVMSEFDDYRKQALLKILLGSCQTFITATSDHDFPGYTDQATFFQIESGVVKSAP